MVLAGDGLGVGIIGLGAIGVTHARVLDQLRPAVELVAYSGGSPAAAAEAGWPTAQQLTADQVINHPDVGIVVVCSPTEFHARNVLDALTAGRHVLAEKPIALTVREADEIAALAKDRGLMVSMISQRRFEPTHQKVKELIEQGVLGDLRLGHTQVHWYRDDAYYASAPWRTTMAGGGGSIMNQGVHNVDLLRWLGGDVEEVSAQYATLGRDMEAENTTVATVRFASGALGTIVVSTATPPGWPATITLHFAGGAIQMGQDEILQWDVADVPRPAAGGGAARGGASDPGAIGLEGHLAQWRDVLSALRAGRAPAIDAEDAARSVRLLCAIYEAAATGRTVRPAELS
jgi:UDP-N-acetyl-2-amino-2-deoxyglucuronate dehydrogenase